MEEEVKHNIDFDEEGNVILKKKVNVKRGSKSRSGGALFERRVREDLMSKGWIVDKWTNNLNLEERKILAAKRVYKKFGKNMGVMTIGTGFPDFIAFQKNAQNHYEIIGVEVKMNGTLKREEKEKCEWYLKNEIFSEVWIAKKIKEKNRVRVIYENFAEIYPKFLI